MRASSVVGHCGSLSLSLSTSSGIAKPLSDWVVSRTAHRHPFGERHARDAAIAAGAPPIMGPLEGMPEAEDLVARLLSRQASCMW